ncbi:MAG: hypothetical protein WAX14_14535 [Rhodococcus sp. (in: high G+C Gram-positive bacteria)]|uniref:hypothetical protein n=1 Tax=Rhodococcus sp. TaxID=1831 RepID=UPI003BB70B65
MSTPTVEPTDELFRSVLEMARTAKQQNISGWLRTRYESEHAEDIAYLTSMMLGVLIENDAIRRGVHPADVWAQLRERGLDEFG